MKAMTLNADVGEDPRRLQDGREAQLMAHVHQANIACGGHAGDDDTMRQTLTLCRAHNIAPGAHPSYPDREGFGRRRLTLSPGALQRELLQQVQRLQGHADDLGITLRHLKPHGALYHAAGDDEATVEVMVAVAQATGLPLVLYHRAPLLAAYADGGVEIWPEAFCDRGVDDDGALIPRGQPGALLDDEAATAAAATFLKGGGVATLCVHSDSPNAEHVAAAVRRLLDNTQRQAP